MRKQAFTVIELLVVVTIIGALMAILLPNLAAALEQARRAQCAANLRGIGQSIKVYSAGNRGKWPSVYKGEDGEAWGEGWTAEDTEIADAIANEGKTPEEMKDDDYPYQCNLSCWWLLIRKGMSNPNVFVCPSADQSVDEDIVDYDKWWSFKDLSNVSYSYQNQLDKSTTDNADAEMIVAADVNPFRGDVAEEPSTRAEDRDAMEKEERYRLNSPNHDFEGQNCLYADGHVTWQNTPYCGIGGNNIWLQSTYDASEDEEPWTEEEDSNDNTGDPIGSKKDSWLVP